MPSMRYALILAGGVGTRLWPLSRRNSPKQVHALLDDETMLQKTYRRLSGQFVPEAIFLSTAIGQAPEIRRQLPNIPPDHIFMEPVLRDTAAAIGYAALRFRGLDPEAVFTTVNSDAYVRDVGAYLQAIGVAQELAESRDCDAVLVGLAPAYPETGYGYIEVAEPVGSNFLEPLSVIRFVEKPDAVTAQQFVRGGRHLWNPALFTFRADRLLEHFATHLPDHVRALAAIKNAVDPQAITQAFLAMPKISIDYGIMEKLRRLVVLPASFGWADVGSWRAVHEILASDPRANVSRGTHVAIESEGNLVVAPEGKVVATCGLDNCVIVDTPDALFVCPRDRAQEVRKVVQELERLGLGQQL